ncbi:MAG: hypothetical protein OXB89_08950 [Anaerolineaceae bacterium]|nr:hypothetical protein [Anaerolineaceae bacterium]
MSALRALLSVIAALLILGIATVAAAQDDTSGETADSPTAEAVPPEQKDMADEMMVRLAGDAIGLELGSYETGWIRYRNDGPDGALLLQVEDVTRFPWMAINNGDSAIVKEDFDDPEFIGDLIQTREIVHDEEMVEGECDTELLQAWFSTDLYCTPGTRVLERGNIFLALFHPVTLDVVALTTTIDNIFGGAQVTRQPAAPSSDSPPVTETARSCGPFAAGQWITHGEYVNSGVILPINADGVWGEITDYQCMVPETDQPYLQAYSIMDVSDDGDGGEDVDVNDDDDDNNDDGEVPIEN